MSEERDVRARQWRRLPMLDGDIVDALTGVEAMMAGLEETGRPALRWYVVERPTLILGSREQVGGVDVAACRAAGVTVHRRRSGGTAVFTDRSALSLDVALPAGHAWLPASVTETYRWFGEAWANALAALGIAAWVVPPDRSRPFNAALDPLVQRACYGGLSPYEVCVGWSKIVGLAQVRRRQGAVLQAGVYTHWEPERLVGLLAATTDERTRMLELLRDRAVGVQDVAGARPDRVAIIQAWERTLANRGVEIAADDWTATERAAARASEERYANLIGDSAPSSDRAV